MSLLSNAIAIPQKGGYNLTNSLRFWANQTTYLSRTPSSAGNRKTWTWSAWVKRSKQTGIETLFKAYTDATNSFSIYFGNTSLSFGNDTGTIGTSTVSAFRDPSAWYHIVFALDTTQATASDRCKLWVNGTLQPLNTLNAPSLNQDLEINNTSAHYLGGYTGYYYDGFITEVNFVDGQALTPSDFGEYDSITGAWKPKKYTGTYGTNGFHLDFSDQTGNTATTIGKDSSGNGNNWTPNNISVTGGINTWNAGSTDVPTLTDEDTANYATLNPLNADNSAGTALITNSALYYYGNGTHGHAYLTIMPTSGKWYFEVRQVDNNAGGIGFRTDYPKTSTTYAHEANKYWIYNASGANFYRLNETSISMLSSPTPATSDILQMAWDVDAGKMWFGINNTWYDSSWGTTGNPSSGTNPFFTVTAGSNIFPFLETGGMQLRFYSGMSGFHYTPPTGFKKLNTYNLPDSAIKDGSQYMNTVTYTGNGSTNAITGVGFSPDLVWIKCRSILSGSITGHQLLDTIRGASNELSSHTTNAEGILNNALYGDMTSFDSDGFTVTDGTDPNNDTYNGSGDSYVAWNWRGSDSSAVSNTVGSIASTVSANTTSGFSVVTYIGNNTSGATVGHGLGVAPSMMIVKNRDNAIAGGDTQSWFVYHTSIGATGQVTLNTTSTVGTSSEYWNNTAPTSTVFSLGSGNRTNYSGDNYIAYCFAEVEGFSKFGSYTGNGTTPNGSFVYTGFRPAFIIVKRSDAAYGWVMFDNKRDTYNYERRYLLANASDAEGTQVEGSGGWTFDFFSNGFRPTGGSAANAINASGGTYIYMAFAENPFKNSLAR